MNRRIGQRIFEAIDWAARRSVAGASAMSDETFVIALVVFLAAYMVVEFWVLRQLVPHAA